ncbi:hypothetical protein MITSMUL_04921 [Mitsuokella multacida DSM 20544]|uniref:Uncharacterized protein n=1 Tax=Mitsuokella multacida DSM 20544 TaxID=500635 RepID=C9KNW8_9FIRM|nr:hypothetical protein MITSMUL_04921 [Mitsuokella multacida DSM 20544]
MCDVRENFRDEKGNREFLRNIYLKNLRRRRSKRFVKCLETFF